MKKIITGLILAFITFSIGLTVGYIDLSYRTLEVPPVQLDSHQNYCDDIPATAMIFDGSNERVEYIANFLIDRKIVQEVNYNPKTRMITLEGKYLATSPHGAGTWIIIDNEYIRMISPNEGSSIYSREELK